MDKGTLCKNHLHTDICASCNGEAPARTTAIRFVPRLGSDIHTGNPVPTSHQRRLALPVFRTTVSVTAFILYICIISPPPPLVNKCCK